MPKIQNILLKKYHSKAPIEYCLSRFLLTFYQTWDELTDAIFDHLMESDIYTLNLLWYTCHNLVEDMNLQKQPLIIKYLTT